jgi:hypothetical protein
MQVNKDHQDFTKKPYDCCTQDDVCHNRYCNYYCMSSYLASVVHPNNDIKLDDGSTQINSKEGTNYDR